MLFRHRVANSPFLKIPNMFVSIFNFRINYQRIRKHRNNSLYKHWYIFLFLRYTIIILWWIPGCLWYCWDRLSELLEALILTLRPCVLVSYLDVLFAHPRFESLFSLHLKVDFCLATIVVCSMKKSTTILFRF